jgi:hypothetical protein
MRVAADDDRDAFAPRSRAPSENGSKRRLKARTLSMTVPERAAGFTVRV